MNNLADITNTLQYIGITLTALAVALLLVRVLEMILRRLARHHVTSTDLDLIGRRAVTTATIRPTRPGKIYCRNAAGQDCIAGACSDHVIRRGQDVLISAVEGGCLRVVPMKTEPPAEGTA